MNPIDNETLRAIGGQKTMEAATSFADTMMRLHQIKKQGELVDLQIATGQYELEQSKEEAPARKEILSSQVKTAQAAGMQAEESMGQDAKDIRMKERQTAALDATRNFELAKSAIENLGVEKATIFTNQQTELAKAKLNNFTTAVSSLQAGSTNFQMWKEQNPDAVAMLSQDPVLKDIMSKNVLTGAGRNLIQKRVVESGPDWAKFQMETDYAKNAELELIRAKADAAAKEAAAAKDDRKPVVADISPDTLKSVFSDLPTELADRSTMAVNDILANIKQTAIPEIPISTIVPIIKQIANDANSRWNEDPNYINQQLTIFQNELLRGDYSRIYAQKYGMSRTQFNEEFRQRRQNPKYDKLTDGQLLQAYEMENVDSLNAEVQKSRKRFEGND